MPAYQSRTRRRRSFRAAGAPSSPVHQGGRALPAPPLQLKPGQGPLQREEDPEKEKKKSDFDYQIKLLPPEAQLSLGAWGLTADTSAANLTYQPGDFAAKFGYKYGGALSAGLDYQGFSGSAAFNPGDLSSSLSGSYGPWSSQLGWQPENKSLSLGGKYQDFNASLSANYGQPGFGLKLGYGAPLLPMPQALSSSVYSGIGGLHGMAGGLPGAMQDPMGYYDSQKANLDAVKAMGGDLQKLYKAQEKGGLPFGAGLQGGYDPLLHWYISAGLQGHF